LLKQTCVIPGYNYASDSTEQPSIYCSKLSVTVSSLNTFTAT